MHCFRSITRFASGLGGLIVGFTILVAGPFFVGGAWEALQVRRMTQTYAQAQGMVVENVLRGGADAAYYPLVEYQTASSQVLRFSDGIGSLPPDYEVGATVDVLYDPADPASAHIGSWKRLWLAPTLFMAVGLIPIAAALAAAYMIESRPRRPLNPAQPPAGRRGL